MLRSPTRDALLDVAEADLARLLRLSDRTLRGRALLGAGGHARRRAGPGTDFLDHQAVQPGADPRAVDWRASARGHGLLARRYHDEAEAEWQVCLDASASMGAAGEAKWALAVQLTAAFVYLLAERSGGVGLLAFSERLEAACTPGRGTAQYARVLHVLAEQVPRPRVGGGSSLEICLPRLRRRQCAVVIGDFLRVDGMHPALGAARALGEVHAVQVLGADECRAPPGPGRAVDAESGEALAVADGRDEAARARRALARHGAALTAYCASRRIGFSTVRAGEHWRDAVARHLVGASPGA